MVNYRLRATLMEVVDTQIENNDPPCTKEVYEKLVKKGFSSVNAKEMIASIVAEEIFYILKGEKEFDEELYSRKVYSLLDSDSFETDSEKFFDDCEVHHMEPIVKDKRIYPNDPCPCGSGKKYKKCCGR